MENIYDMIIVGGGPAGLSSSIYMARAKYKVLLLEKKKMGGQIMVTPKVVNYPGVVKTSGKELMAEMQTQAENFGTEIKMCEVLDIDMSSDVKIVKTSEGELKSLAVLLAVGAAPRAVGFDGEKKFKGRGVAYCATCDGEFFSGMPLYVVGSGISAVEEGIFLTKYASEVHMLVKGDDFTCPKEISDKVYKENKITVHFNTEIVSVSGEESLETITLKNNKTDETCEKSYPDSFGVFIFDGHLGSTGWIEDKVETEKGYIVTDKNQQTNVSGVYAAGDVCIKDLRQVVTAVSDGAIAATSAEKYVSALKARMSSPNYTPTKNEPTKPQAEKKPASDSSADENFISSEIREQLTTIFAMFTSKVVVNAVVDGSDLGREFAGFIGELEGISANVTCKQTKLSEEEQVSYLELLREGETSSNLRFYAMPGGHEFNSFVLALYNLAGPGKEIEKADSERIMALDKEVDVKVLISLSCTMCPEVVVATCKMATLNNNAKVSIMDIAHFPEIKKAYKVMSVPCMVVNDDVVQFGKKSMSQILDIIEGC